MQLAEKQLSTYNIKISHMHKMYQSNGTQDGYFALKLEAYSGST